MITASILSGIGTFLLNALIDFVNLLIAAVGAVIAIIMLLLPPMPPVPTAPPSGFLHDFAYFYPVGAVVAALVTFVAAYVAVLVIRIALRWVKAL